MSVVRLRMSVKRLWLRPTTDIRHLTSDIYSTWIVEQLLEIYSSAPELIRRWHPIISHQSFDGGQVPVTVHAGDCLDAVPLHVEGKEILCGHVALEDDLVPACGVTDVQKSGVELPRPEEGHSSIRDCASGHIARRDAPLLQRRPPVLDALPGACQRRMEARDVSGGVQTVGRPQVFINHHAAVIGKLDSLEKIRRGLDADADHDQIGVNLFAGLNLNRFNFAVAGYSRNLRAESEPHAVVLVYLLE